MVKPAKGAPPPAKRESKPEKAARMAQEKKDKEEARKKVVTDDATARAQANSQKPATSQDRIAKKPKAKPAACSGSEQEPDEVGVEHEGTQDSDEEEDENDDWYALPTGDASCGQQQCGLGSAMAKFNCKRHERAAKEQASSSEGPRELRRKKSTEPKEREPSTQEQQKKPDRKKDQHSSKRVDAQVQKALTAGLAPYLDQMKTMTEQLYARAVRPFSTGYIR